MKRHWFLAAFLGLGAIYWLAVSRAQSPEPHALLKKAIEAHGGEKNVSKPRMGYLKGSAKADGREINQDETFDLPKQWKRITSGSFQGKKRVSFDLMKEGRLWSWDEGGEVMQADGRPSPAQSLFGALTMLLKFKQEQVTLVPLPPITANGKSAVGFRATWDGGATDCFFDQKTALLSQTRFVWVPEPGKEFESKTSYSEYKHVDGVHFPFRKKTHLRIATGGDFIPFDDFVISEVRIVDALPKNAFSLPEKK